MFYKIASILATTAAIELNEASDEVGIDTHYILDSFMEKEEDVYNWFEIENSTMKSVSGGTFHFLNVTSQRWLDVTKAYGPNGDDIWSHHVAVNIPKNLKHKNMAISYNTGRCNEHDSELPSAH